MNRREAMAAAAGLRKELVGTGWQCKVEHEYVGPEGWRFEARNHGLTLSPTILPEPGAGVAGYQVMLSGDGESAGGLSNWTMDRHMRCGASPNTLARRQVQYARQVINEYDKHISILESRLGLDKSSAALYSKRQLKGLQRAVADVLRGRCALPTKQKEKLQKALRESCKVAEEIKE